MLHLPLRLGLHTHTHTLSEQHQLDVLGGLQLSKKKYPSPSQSRSLPARKALFLPLDVSSFVVGEEREKKILQGVDSQLCLPVSSVSWCFRPLLMRFRVKMKRPRVNRSGYNPDRGGIRGCSHRLIKFMAHIRG